MSRAEATDGRVTMFIALSYQDERSDKVWKGFVRDGRLHVRFGRRGTRLQERVIQLPYRHGSATGELEARAKRKAKSGYVIQRWESFADDSDGDTQAPPEPLPENGVARPEQAGWGGSPAWFV